MDKLSQKRKLEEYHDPDYPQYTEPKRQCTNNLSGPEKYEKIKSIIKREFQTELSQKEQEIYRIEMRISQAKKLLQRVRYAVVASYYSKKGLELPEPEIAKQQSETSSSHFNTDSTAQLNRNSVEKPKAIHPSLKKLFGKKPIDYDEILSIRPTRKAARTATSTIREKLKTKKEEKKLKSATIPYLVDSSNMKMPRYIAPNKIDKPIEQLNSNRGRNQEKHLITVGNTSKYIGNEKSIDGVTHKWLVYIGTKTETPIKEILTKVRFFLHPSYKPNDVVEVTSAPFQLSRRGWGEFPIRVQLYFNPVTQQKPLQIIHNLVLDRKHTGLQTMGAETVVEMWLSGLSTPPIEGIKKAALDEGPKEDETLQQNTFIPFFNEINRAEDFDISKSDLLHSADNNLISNGSLCETSKMTVPIVESEPGLLVSDSPAVKQEFVEVSKPIKRESLLKEIKDIKNMDENELKNAVPTLVPVITSSANNTITPPTKRLIRCLDKTGKTIFLEVAVDADDPKKFKIIGNAMSNSGTNSTLNAVSPIKLNNIKVLSTTPPTSTLPSPVIKPPTKIIISPKLSGFLLKPHQISQTLPDKLLQSPEFQKTKSISTTPTFSGIKFLKNPSQNLGILPNNNSPKNAMVSSNCRAITISPSRPNQYSVLTKSPSTINKNQIIMKNGQIIIIDSDKDQLGGFSKNTKAQKSLAKPKQISLLKPKPINSLLKPINNNNNVENIISSSNFMKTESLEQSNNISVSIDHDYTGLSPYRRQSTILVTPNRKHILANNSIVPSESPKTKNKISLLNIRNTIQQISFPNFNSISLDDNKSVFPVKMKKMDKSGGKNHTIFKVKHTNYKNHLRGLFQKLLFDNIEMAVGYLLKRLPLITKMANQTDYKISFPFSVCNEEYYKKLPFPKQRCNEWCRAKMINKLLRQHEKLYSQQLWSTKEIILFARKFHYTPPISKFLCSALPSSLNTKEMLKDMVTKEIKREKTQNSSISFNHSVYEWINEKMAKIGDTSAFDEGNIINVDDSDDDNCDGKRKYKNNSEMFEMYTSETIWLPLDKDVEQEASFLSDVCSDIQIRLKPEALEKDVMQPVAQLLLMQALKSFNEDLIRRAYASKTESERISDDAIVQTIQPDDVKNAILSRPEFDFLTNRFFGVVNVKKHENII